MKKIILHSEAECNRILDFRLWTLDVHGIVFFVSKLGIKNIFSEIQRAKSNILTLLLLSAVLQWHCHKQDRGFQMIYRSTPASQYDINFGLDPFASHIFVRNSISTDTSLFFSTNNVTASQLGRITPYSMMLRAVYQDGVYDFINKIEVYISDPSRPNLGDVLVFYNYDIPLTSGTQIALIPADTDVTPFLIKGKNFTLKTKYQFTVSPPRTITTGWDIAFFARY